jgi:hypothetical protein
MCTTFKRAKMSFSRMDIQLFKAFRLYTRREDKINVL